MIAFKINFMTERSVIQKLLEKFTPLVICFTTLSETVKALFRDQFHQYDIKASGLKFFKELLNA